MIGSIEVIDSFGGNRGVQGDNLTLEVVPLVVNALFGVTGLVDEQNGFVGSGGPVPIGQWTGTDAAGFPVAINLWDTTPPQEGVGTQDVVDESEDEE